ncbi:MAG: hypothetical protein NVS3B10_00410 [Polyangiales bacterium]
MAGRIRSIKPELLEDEETAGLSHVAFRLFVGMILVADDHGNLRASRAWLKGQVFHGTEITDRAFDSALAELTRKLVEVYSVGDQTYAHVNGWAKHQRIDNAMAPRVPLPPGWECVEELRAEGSRRRARFFSRCVGADGAAPEAATRHAGAAPDTQTRRAGAELDAPRGGGGAAGSRSPISDHRPPTTEAGTPPDRRRATPPRLPPDHWLTAGLAESPLLVGCDHGALAAVAQAQAAAAGRTDDEIQAAAEEAIAILGRAYNSAAGVGDPGAYVAETITRLLKPGGLEVRQSETAPRDAASGTQRAARASPVHPGRFDPASESERRQRLADLAARPTGTGGGSK